MSAIVQNWIGEPFAGDAYTSFDDWSAVHTAARSAADAVEDLLS